MKHPIPASVAIAGRTAELGAVTPKGLFVHIRPEAGEYALYASRDGATRREAYPDRLQAWERAAALRVGAP